MLRVGVGLREDERVVGDRRVRDPVLLAVQDVAVALAARVRQHRGDVGARGRLGQAEAGDLLAARLRGEVALLLLLVRVLEERERVEPDVDGDERAEGRLAALDLLAGRAPRRRSPFRRRRTPPGMTIPSSPSSAMPSMTPMSRWWLMSFSIAFGSTRSSTNWRTVACTSRCSGVSSKSTGLVYGGRLLDSDALRAEAGARPVRRERAVPHGQAERVVRGRARRIALAALARARRSRPGRRARLRRLGRATSRPAFSRRRRRRRPHRAGGPGELAAVAAALRVRPGRLHGRRVRRSRFGPRRRGTRELGRRRPRTL